MLKMNMCLVTGDHVLEELRELFMRTKHKNYKLKGQRPVLVDLN